MRSSPAGADHRFTALSSEPEASVAPSRAKARWVTARLCPSSALESAPEAVHHRRTDLSREPVASVAPSGENATLVT